MYWNCYLLTITRSYHWHFLFHQLTTLISHPSLPHSFTPGLNLIACAILHGRPLSSCVYNSGLTHQDAVWVVDSCGSKLLCISRVPGFLLEAKGQVLGVPPFNSSTTCYYSCTANFTSVDEGIKLSAKLSIFTKLEIIYVPIVVMKNVMKFRSRENFTEIEVIGINLGQHHEVAVKL